MIELIWLDNERYKREFKFVYARETRVLFIGLWFVGLMIDFGKKFRNEMRDHISRIKDKGMNRLCKVCSLRLQVSDWKDGTKYHKPCRRYRYKTLKDEQLENLIKKVKMLYNV